MNRIERHPILDVTSGEKVTFYFDGKPVIAEKGFTIAAALHQAGYPVHSHSLQNRKRSLECGIGKCGACEMLVDGQIKRICITTVDNVKQVSEIPKNYRPGIADINIKGSIKVYKTGVAIIGAGPSGLAVRETLMKHDVPVVVIDNNSNVGGQFMMQTHQFFFFEKEMKFGGKRGFEIGKELAGNDKAGIYLDTTVWDIFEGNRIACRNIKTSEIFYVDAEYLVIATGAVPYMPPFENDDVPGVYTAAVIQKMMNQEFTLLGKNVLTVGAGNIGYLTSYQLLQAGAKVKAIIEAQPFEGGFPVQANRIKRYGIPILLSHTLLKAIPNDNYDGVKAAVIAKCKDFVPIPGTEMLIEGIDAINICTGLVSDDSLLIKGKEVFGRQCFGAGDAIRIGEGTSAVLKGKQVAYEILEEIGERYDHDYYLSVSKEYIDSQQHPAKVLETPVVPSEERTNKSPFVIIDCLFGFACNPCVFACPHAAITKSSTSTVPIVDYDKCTGCMECVYHCPGLAITGFNPKKEWIFISSEFEETEGSNIHLVDNSGKIVGEGVVEKVFEKANKTRLLRVKTKDVESLFRVRGGVHEKSVAIELQPYSKGLKDQQFICHCDDVKLEDVLDVIGDRKFVSVDEIKHTTRLGMGACRGKRCIKRLKSALKAYNVSLIGEPTPRGPLANQLAMGELFPKNEKDNIVPHYLRRVTNIVKVDSLIAGGGIAGSSLFRYFAEAGLKPLLINYGHGASWRNIAGGRPNFSVPELTDIAKHNLELFKQLQGKKNIDFRLTKYVTFAHDEEMLHSLERSLDWQDGKIVYPESFHTEISPFYNSKSNSYLAALLTNDCWQATPGKTIDLLRNIAIQNGGEVLEDAKLVDLRFEDGTYKILIQNHQKEYTEYQTKYFTNALGPEGERFARLLGIETGLYPVRHQAFITRRLPNMGINGEPLPMLIDRKRYKGFIAIYGQQLAETGQIIGCASPAVDPAQTGKNIRINTRDFVEIASEIFVNWIPELSSVGFQAIWSGYYIEPRMIIDPYHGLFLGLRGQGFMLSQYLAKVYVDKLMGKKVPEYMERLKLEGDGLLEKEFK